MKSLITISSVYISNVGILNDSSESYSLNKPLIMVTGQGKTTLLEAINAAITGSMQSKLLSIGSDCGYVYVFFPHKDEPNYVEYSSYMKEKFRGEKESRIYFKEGTQISHEEINKTFNKWRRYSERACCLLLEFISAALEKVVDKKIQIYFFNGKVFLLEDYKGGLTLNLWSNSYLKIVGLMIMFLEESFNKTFGGEFSEDSFEVTVKALVEKRFVINCLALIDNIDSGMNPNLHVKLLDVFLEYFPHFQFIVTTNSPIMISYVSCFKKALLYSIYKNKLQLVPFFYGKSIGESFYNLFGLPYRPDKVKDLIECLEDYWEELPSSDELSTQQKDFIESKILEIKNILGEDDPTFTYFSTLYNSFNSLKDI